MAELDNALSSASYAAVSSAQVDASSFLVEVINHIFGITNSLIMVRGR